MRKLLLVLFLAVFSAAAWPARARQTGTASEPPATPAPAPEPEEKELAELMSIIEEETEVATKTRMNSDYVPGIVTVLEGDELEALGIETAGEALGLVPGVQATADVRGTATVLVRGLDFPFNVGNVQVLINSIAITRDDAGLNASSLMIPVEQIERIEFIRGPGSVVYGDYALMGLVNIITRRSGTRLRARADNYSWSGGARTAWQSPDKSWSTSASLSRYASNDAPPRRNGAEDDRWFGVVNFTRGGASLTAQGVKRDFDGLQNGPDQTYSEKSWALEGRYRRELSKILSAEGRVAYLDNSFDVFSQAFEGSVARGGFDVLWDGLARQSWLFGAEVTQSTTDVAANRPANLPPNAPRRVLIRDTTRDIISGVLQDRIDVTGNLAVTLGMRYDNYSDLKDRFTPRLTMLYRLSNKHIVKAQYAEGFRPPTFFEQFSPPPPNFVPRPFEFEYNATKELNYIYRSAGRVARVTLFHSIIRDILRPAGQVTLGTAASRGVELEWDQEVREWLKVSANVTRQKTRDPRGGPRDINLIAPDWMSNLSLFVRPLAKTLAGVRWNHIGERVDNDGYDTVDFTLSRQDVFFPGFDVRAGVKNAFDDDIAFLNVRPNATVAVMPFPGRSVFFQVSWKR